MKRKMFKRVRFLFFKELIQVLRDKRLRITLIFPPIFQLIVFGYAANLDVKNINTAIRDLAQSVESRELINRFGSSKYFNIISYPQTPKEIETLIKNGDVILSIEIPNDFSRKLKKGDTATVQIILDGTESNTAMIALGYLSQILSEYSTTIMIKRLNRQGMVGFEAAGVELEHRIWFNPNAESRLFYVPGVIASIAFLLPIILTAQAIVRDREMGTLEQIMVTPIRSWELMLGKTLPFAMIGLLDAIMIALIGIFWFEVPLRGNPFVLLLGSILFLMSSVGIGLFISTISSTQQQAQISTFFFMMAPYSLRFCFSIREYARMASNNYLCEPATVLFNYHSWGFLERKWFRYPVARDVSLSRVRRFHDYLEFPEIPEETEVKIADGRLQISDLKSKISNLKYKIKR